MPSPRVSRLFLISFLLLGCGAPPSVPTETAPGQPEASVLGIGRPEACVADEHGCALVRTGSPILIGTALTLTGPDAGRGLDSQFGAQVALNLRGEVLGHEVELVHRDDRCDRVGGMTAASELRSIEGLVAVLGTSCSAAAPAAAEILGANGILLLSPSNTAPWLTDRGSRPPFYLRVAPNDGAQAAAMAEFVCSELAVETAATVRDGSALAARLESNFVTEFADGCEGQLTERAEVGDGRASVARAMADIAVSNRGAPPELLYVPLAADGRRTAALEAGRTPGLQDALLSGVLSGLDGRDESAVRNAEGAVDEVYLSGIDLGLSGQFYESIFLAEYSRISGMDPVGVFHGHAYDGVNIVLDAVESVAIPTADGLYVPRGELFRTVASTREYEGLTGRLTCSDDGDCAELRVSVWQLQADELQRVWP